jgi:hypothetical protein
VAVGQRWLSLSDRDQNAEKCTQHALGSGATSCIIEAIAEEFRVITQVGNDEYADHLGATDSLQPNNGSIMGTERLGRVEEALQAGSYKTRFEHMRRVGELLCNQSEEGRCKVTKGELFGQIAGSAKLSPD